MPMIASSLYSLFITVVFCLGWSTITSEGNLLYFLKKPFERNYDKLELSRLNGFINVKQELTHFIGKPFILCITCMASIWGITIYSLTIENFTISGMIINSVSASFLQTFIYRLNAKLD